MILLWDVQRAAAEGPGTSAAEREYIGKCQLNFWFNECFNPFAHQNECLHTEPVLPYYWSEAIVMKSVGDTHQMRWVGCTLHRHWSYAFDPCLAIFHRRRLVEVFWEPQRIPVLLGRWYPALQEWANDARIKRTQRWAFRAIRTHARTRWLAAVRVILLLGFGSAVDLGDLVDKHILARLRDWDASRCYRRGGTCAADMPDNVCDDSTYILEESVERALQGALVTFPAGSKRRRLD
jgi:hypothetical protein